MDDENDSYKRQNLWLSGHGEKLCNTYDEIVFGFRAVLDDPEVFSRGFCFDGGLVELVTVREDDDCVKVVPAASALVERLRESSGEKDVFIVCRRFQVFLPSQVPDPDLVVLSIETYQTEDSSEFHLCSLQCRGGSEKSARRLRSFFGSGAVFDGAARGLMSKYVRILHQSRKDLFINEDCLRLPFIETPDLEYSPLEYVAYSVSKLARMKTDWLFGA